MRTACIDSRKCEFTRGFAVFRLFAQRASCRGLAFILSVSAVLVATLSTALAGDAFVATGSMAQVREGHTSTLLNDGRVLITGGAVGNFSGCPGVGGQVNTAEIYDPQSGTFSPTGSMAVARVNHSAIRLDDGRVLVVGGWTNCRITATNLAEIYNPTTGMFSSTGSMSIARGDNPPIIKLSDGKVLVLGGTFEGGFGTATSQVDLYDPTAGTFTVVGNLALSRRDHGAVALQDGRILLFGGLRRCCSDPGNPARLTSAEIYDPSTHTASLLAASMNFSHSRNTNGALLSDGRVLIVSGSGNGNEIELFDPVTMTFAALPSLPAYSGLTTHSDHATLLDDGRVLISSNPSLVFEPVPNSLIDVSPVSHSIGIVGHRVTRLNNGSVLVSGGRTLGTLTASNAAFLFTSAESELSTVADSFLRGGSTNRNEGANPRLRIQATGNNRAVVAFDLAEIGTFVSSGLTKATLTLTIAENANNWGQAGDRTVDAHPLNVGFAEGNGQNAGVPASQSTRGFGPGVTWKCAIDAEIANQQPNCDPKWNGGDFGAATAEGILHINGLTGPVSWDVTDDVLAGATSWLIKKTLEGPSGKVFYFSREGAQDAGDESLAPTLLLER